MKLNLQQQKSKIPQQSDIVIDSKGIIHISFFWEDLKDLGNSNCSESLKLPSASSTDRVIRPQREMKFPDLDTVREEYRSCRLCPKACGFNRINQIHPRCGDWQIRVSNAGLSLGDEAMIAGSRGSGVVMLSGCPLSCYSCHNPEMVADGIPLTQNELFDLAWDLAERGAQNLQLLSPTVHTPLLLPVLKALKESQYPIPIIFKSSGYESVKQIRRFSGLIDIYLPDFKFGGCSALGSQAGARNYYEIASAVVDEMLVQTGSARFSAEGGLQSGVLVRHVKAPMPAVESAIIQDTLLDFEKRGAKISILDNFVPFD